MDKAKLKIRLVCEDDVNDLWENVYSAMTPRQIKEDKILLSIANYKNQNGFLAVAELEGKAVMTMWVERVWSSPGFIFDTVYKWQNNDNDRIFTELLEGAKYFAKHLYMNVLCLMASEDEDSPYIEGFIRGGFKKAFSTKDIYYYMCEI